MIFKMPFHENPRFNNILNTKIFRFEYWVSQNIGMIINCTNNTKFDKFFHRLTQWNNNLTSTSTRCHSRRPNFCNITNNRCIGSKEVNKPTVVILKETFRQYAINGKYLEKRVHMRLVTNFVINGT